MKNCWWECKMLLSLWKTIWCNMGKLRHNMGKLNIKLIVQFKYSTPKNLLKINEKNTFTQSLAHKCYIALFKIVQNLKHSNIQMVTGLKMWYIFTKGHYLTIKRNEVLSNVAAWMNLRNMLSKSSQMLNATCWFQL